MKHAPRSIATLHGPLRTLLTAAWLTLLTGFTASRAATPPVGPPRHPAVPSAAPPEFTAADWVLCFVVADVGTYVGVALGTDLWVAEHAGNGDRVFRQDPIADEIALVAMPTLASVGAAAMVYACGSAGDHRGSYWAALGGSTLGSLATLGVLAAVLEAEDPEEGTWAVAVAAFTLPALGATVGYYLSRDTAPRPAVSSPALLDLGRDGVPRLQVPALSVVPQRSGVAATVLLLGGAL